MVCAPVGGERDALRGLRTVVLCGGPGVEREVSLESGACVQGALAADGFDVRLADVRGAHDVRALSADIFLSMLHGEFGEDGGVQQTLETMGAAYAGSGPEASALAFDKHAAKRRFLDAGIPTPAAVRFQAGDPAASAEELAARCRRGGVGGPWVVKPNARGSSVGVSIVREATDLPGALAGALAVDEAALAEAYVAGREFTVGVWGGEGREEALKAIELIPDGEFYDYNAKYRSERTRYRGRTPLDTETADRLRALALMVFAALGLRDLARIDMILDADNRPWVLEANTAPGFTSHSLFPMAATASGMSLADVCATLAAFAWRRRAAGGGSRP